MIAAVGCLLIALACQDVERVAVPPRTPATAHALAGPPVVLAVTCTVTRSSSAISCTPATARRGAGASGNVILAPTGTYVQFAPFNLVKDTVKQIWSFDAFLHNLLQQSIGTLNGVAAGGEHSQDGSLGYYYLKVPDDGSGSGVRAAILSLIPLRQVQIASYEAYLDPLYLRPNDGRWLQGLETEP